MTRTTTRLAPPPRAWIGLACLAAAAALLAWSASRAPESAPDRAWIARLAGPVARLAAALQWARVDDAWNHGHTELADRRAQTALELAPEDAAGWLFYGRHLVYDRASALREPRREDRARWVQAGLDVLARGERCADRAGQVAFGRAVVYLSLAQYDDGDRPSPLTRAQAWRAAAEAFERAADLGEPVAREAAASAREQAAEADAGR